MTQKTTTFRTSLRAWRHIALKSHLGTLNGNTVWTHTSFYSFFPVYIFVKGSFTRWRQRQNKWVFPSFSLVMEWVLHPILNTTTGCHDTEFSPCCWRHYWAQNPFHDDTKWRGKIWFIFRCHRSVNEFYLELYIYYIKIRMEHFEDSPFGISWDSSEVYETTTENFVW